MWVVLCKNDTKLVENFVSFGKKIYVCINLNCLPSSELGKDV